MAETNVLEHSSNKATMANDQEKDILITTIDNPYDPKYEFDAWLTYDAELGYNTLQRLAKTADYIRERNKNDDEELLFQAAIAEMIRLDPLKVYTIKAYPHTDPGTVRLTDEEKRLQDLGRELTAN